MNTITPHISEPELAQDNTAVVPQTHPRLERITSRSMAAMQFDLSWESATARHTECHVATKLNLWRDIFPPEVEADLIDQPAGYRVHHEFKPGSVISPYREEDRFTIDHGVFNRYARNHTPIEPRLGRYYPKGFIAGIRDYFIQDLTPFRITGIGEDLSVDVNHPLAGRKLGLATRILDIWAASDEHGGRCNDVIEYVLQNGPGMQARFRNQPTDFWSDAPFSRSAEGPDKDFYESPRFVDHIDATATSQIEGLYSRLCKRGGSVLDLMASWKSHLPPSLDLSEVAGLGMNREELGKNPLFGEKIVQDLNLEPTLPFDNGRFDTVVCTVSVEYLAEPVQVFSEVNRVLKHDGRFIITFSNRWFPPKVVKIWKELHEFERPGLVLEYFLKSGGFTGLETWSMRGLPRPADDKYADRLASSDPVYAVWGTKS
ncbi:MAG: methyltransferase domain-containing protein [Gammaproteobacteria bacterium]|nr:MAG: methyltransferase domain-containing protein [Gammaproteobacteria bacterium]